MTTERPATGWNLQRVTMHPGETPAGGRGHVTFALDGGMERAKRVKATIGVDDETQGRGSVGFILEIFRSGAWQSVFTSPVLRGGPEMSPRQGSRTPADMRVDEVRGFSIP